MDTSTELAAIALLVLAVLAVLAVIVLAVWGVFVAARAMFGLIGGLIFAPRRRRPRAIAHPYGSPETHPALTVRRGGRR